MDPMQSEPEPLLAPLLDEDQPNLPEELVVLPQWVNWEGRVKQGRSKIAKVPLNPNPVASDEMNEASHSDPSTWADYATAWRVLNLTQRNPNNGVGFVFVDGQQYIGVDFDDPDKLASDEARQKQANLIHKLLELGTYVEWSPSRKGLHFILKSDNMNPNWGLARVDETCGIEVYRGERYFTMTGHVGQFGVRPIVTDNDFAYMVFNGTSRAVRANDVGTIPQTEEHGRLVNSTDTAVLDKACQINKSFMSRYQGREWLNNDWSGTLNSLIGDLDKACGDPQQIYRLLEQCPFVQHSGDDARGTSRLDKFSRTFGDNLIKARESNNALFVERSKKTARVNIGMLTVGGQTLGSVIHREQEQAELAQRRLAKRLLDDPDNERNEIGYSVHAVNVCRQLGLEPRSMAKQLPQGRMGFFIQEIFDTTIKPSLDITTLVSLTYMSGMFGRSYKLFDVDGIGPSLVSLLVSGTGTGKTSTVNRISQLLHGIKSQKPAPDKSHQIQWSGEVQLASAEGAYSALHSRPFGMFFNDEAGTFIKDVLAPEQSNYGNTDKAANLTSFYNGLFDAPRHGHKLQQSMSVAGMERKKLQRAHDTENVAPSLLLATTPERADIYSSTSVSSGAAARTLIVYQEGRPGDIRLEGSNRPFSGSLVAHMRRILTRVEDYEIQQMKCAEIELKLAGLPDTSVEERNTLKTELANKRGRMRSVDTTVIHMSAEAHHCRKIMLRRVDNIMNDIDDTTLWTPIPDSYKTLNRICMMADRVAGVLAVFENPDNPLICDYQWQWAFEYLLYHKLRFLSKADNGEFQNVGSDYRDLIMAAFKKLYLKALKNPSTTTSVNVRSYDLFMAVRYRKCVALPNSQRNWNGRLLRSEFDMRMRELSDAGIFTLDRIEVETKSGSRKVEIVYSTDHEDWHGELG